MPIIRTSLEQRIKDEAANEKIGKKIGRYSRNDDDDTGISKIISINPLYGKAEPKKRGRPKNIMKGRADIDGNKVITELNIKKGLQPKVKRALKKSVISELESKMKGGRIRTISLSDSDSD